MAAANCKVFFCRWETRDKRAYGGNDVHIERDRSQLNDQLRRNEQLRRNVERLADYEEKVCSFCLRADCKSTVGGTRSQFAILNR